MRLTNATIARLHDEMLDDANAESGIRTQSMHWKRWADLSQAEQEYVIRLADCVARECAP